ncbi:MAG: CDP-alcohol phosphatidyltransferase family protein [Candidatus Eisenbacteria bacterium]|nr:CDP-alcohol phosphatidyltransferase family protein [Candidatus Eisenbacteria bacterium]
MCAMLSPDRKEWVRSLLHPLVRLCGQLRIQPNALSVTGLVLAALSGLVIADGHPRFGAILFLMGGLFDMLDGSVARAAGTGSPFGAFLDSTLDRYAEIFVYLGLAYWMRHDALFLLPFVVISGSLMVSYTRARVEGLGGACAVGLLERPERIVILFLGLLLGGWLLDLALLLLAVGSHYTAFQRMRHARKVL